MLTSMKTESARSILPLGPKRPLARALLSALTLLTSGFVIFPDFRSIAAGQEHDHGSSTSHKGKMVTFPNGDQVVNGYLATPKGKRAHSAVIVIHEWWGLNDQIQSVADDFASKGYVALAPDLYGGRVASDPSVAVELMKATPEAAATSTLSAALRYLSNHPSVGDRPIGSIGFCMGGRLSLLLAMAEPKLSACVICYGRPETEPSKLASIKAPVLAIFGGADKGIPLEMTDRFNKAMEEAGKSIDVRIRGGAPHGFMNPQNPGHSPRDTKEAWTVIDAFFAKTLSTRGSSSVGAR